MIYKIRHSIEYAYSSPVTLEAHRLYLTPRSDAFQTLKDFHLQVFPAPVLQSEFMDLAGNRGHELWFRGVTDHLKIETSASVSVHCDNPFDYLLRENAVYLPAAYSEELKSQIQPYCSRVLPAETVKVFTDEVAACSGNETIGFLSELCLKIHRRIRFEHRDQGPALLPAETLARGRGACRDLAVLFIACCHAQRLAARFTSGYTYGTSDEGMKNELHAWAEVYLEGAGWRGYDPSTGLVVCDRYAASASAPEPRLIAPVTGAFRSRENAIAVMRTQVSVGTVPETAPKAAFSA